MWTQALLCLTVLQATSAMLLLRRGVPAPVAVLGRGGWSGRAVRMLAAGGEGKAKQTPAQKQSKAKKPDSPYKSTVILPQTAFNQRADSKIREPQLQAYWKEHRIYETLAESNPGDVYVLHDGPPYANGDLHIGHALNKILKVGLHTCVSSVTSGCVPLHVCLQEQGKS
jgi:tRNA synthetases class I (I, L, M and V)